MTPDTSRLQALAEAAITIARVQQEDVMGCGVACLAMVSGRTYAEVRAEINPAQIEHGLSDYTVIWWLNRTGIYSRRSWMDGGDSRPVPTSGVSLMLTHDAHWLLLVDGVVLDPARATPLPRYFYRQAIEVLTPASLAALARSDAQCASLLSELRALRADARLVQVMQVTGHGAWLDASTGKWVSAAGRNFSSAAAFPAALAAHPDTELTSRDKPGIFKKD